MRTNLPSLLFVSLTAAALSSCGASVDSTSLAESSAECVGEPEAVFVVPAPDPRVIPAPPTVVGVVNPGLGPLVDTLILPRDLGYSCDHGPECASGNCFDGVCCDMPCAGGCEACNLSGSAGFCIAHEFGTDPEGGCSGSACFAGQEESFSCDGVGACQAQFTPCGSYACGVTECMDACRGDEDCADRAHCVAGSCEPE